MRDDEVKDVPLGYDTNRHLAQREIEITGKRFCTTCQRQQLAEGGLKRGPRWMCAACVKRRAAREPTKLGRVY